jgi:hypothetical protein
MSIQDGANDAGNAGDLANNVKMWLEAGIPAVIPGSQFRDLCPMGTTFFYDEINSGRLRAVKHAGKACIAIEEAVRYKNSLPPLEPAIAA